MHKEQNNEIMNQKAIRLSESVLTMSNLLRKSHLLESFSCRRKQPNSLSRSLLLRTQALSTMFAKVLHAAVLVEKGEEMRAKHF